MGKSPQLWIVSFATTPDAAGRLADTVSEDSLALTIFNPPRAKEARVEALFSNVPDRAQLTARLAVTAKLLGRKMPKLDIRETPKLDWLKKVAGDFPPLPIARWVVHGAQHAVDVRNALQIDATSAFGTGEHPTTRGCLIMLERILKRRNRTCLTDPSPDPSRKGRGTPVSRAGKNSGVVTGNKFSSNIRFPGSSPLAGEDRRGVGATRAPARLLDLGCGSGILAMAWAQTTHGCAIAVDFDPESVAVARNNVRVNGLQDNVRVGFSRGYSAPLVTQNAPYDLITANIFAGPLSQMAKDLKQHLRPGGRAILAGLLTRQANKVLAAHRMQGIFLEKRLVIGEWTMLALRRR